MTYDGSSASSGIKLHLNGSLIESSDDNAGSYTAMHNTTQPLTIGQFNNSAYANGHIDEVAIFNSELSASDIANIYNSGVPADLSGFSSLVSWWRFEEGSGTTAIDSGTGGNNGSIDGATYSTDVPS